MFSLHALRGPHRPDRWFSPRAVFTACAASAVMLSAWPAASAGTASAAIKLPPETARLRPSPLPGYTAATQKCATCHSADYINYQPPGMNQVQWTAEVAKMQHAYGAPISDDDVQQIGAYLAVAYGSAQAGDAAVVAASAAAKPALLGTTASAGSADTPAAAVDVQALLGSNACLSCHALAQKIVGPAFHDVAAKYKGDAQALAKVQASIRQGGVGKWGQVPMPPMAGLSPVQLKALAEFVLKQ